MIYNWRQEGSMHYLRCGALDVELAYVRRRDLTECAIKVLIGPERSLSETVIETTDLEAVKREAERTIKGYVELLTLGSNG